jgi:uncharacterized protein YabN with tetrapyrrole methylase and pyrophosphatase domain
VSDQETLQPFSLTRARVRETHDAQYDIVVVGAGIDRSLHLTDEAKQAIASARVVFVSGHVPAIVDAVAALAPTVERRLQEADEYELGAHRPAMYERIATRIVDEALEGPGVVVVQPGSAVVVDRITRLICQLAHERSLRVRILPGIGAVETVLAAVGYDVAFGVQVVLAQQLFVTDLRLGDQWASVVLQPAYYDTNHFVCAPVSLPGRLNALAGRLGVAAHPHRTVALVHTAVDGHDDQLVWVRLDELDQTGGWLSPYHTMFLPPVEQSHVDVGAFARSESFDELLSHIETRSQQPVQLRSTTWLDTESHLTPDQRRRSRAMDAAWRTTIGHRA